MSVSKLKPSLSTEPQRLNIFKKLFPEVFADGAVNWESFNHSLGIQTEEEVDELEHFGLFWPGKSKSRKLAGMPSQGTLIPNLGDGLEEATTTNIFIEGDNLEVLKLLKKSYAGLVKLIYIDIPYNTGADFVYNDNYGAPLEQYLRLTGQTDEEGVKLTTNPESSGRFHSTWLSMIYPRLMAARYVLRQDGLIIISIDDNEVEHLRMVCNEIFGEENFVAQICVQSNPRGRQADTYFATVHEYLLMYARDREFCSIAGAPLTNEQRAEFDKMDSNGKAYRLLGLRQRGAASLRQDRPDMFFPIYVNPKTLKVSLDPIPDFTEKVLPKKSTGEDGRWMWGPDKCKRDIELLVPRLIERRSEYDIFVKDFLEKEGEERTRKFKTIWDSSKLNTQNGTQEVKELLGCAAMSFPKPVALLQDILVLATEDNDLIFDFFAGSGTTGHAVMQQNAMDGLRRKFILVQLPEPLDPSNKEQKVAASFCDQLGKPRNLAEVTKERLRRSSRKVQREHFSEAKTKVLDLGFRCFKLAKSNFKPWNDYVGQSEVEVQTLFDKHETPLVEGWKRNDLITEILLMEGFPLDSKLTPLRDVLKNEVFVVESEHCSYKLLVCLEKTIYAETIKTLTVGSQDVFVCLDTSLTDLSKLRLADQCNLKVI